MDDTIFWPSDRRDGDNSLPGDDADGDGVSNLQEYLNGTNPTDYYNGVLPKLTVVSGDRQVGDYDSFIPSPIDR